MERFTDQFGREIRAPSPKAAKHIAAALLTPPQRVDYEVGRLQIRVVDELGRQHLMIYGGKGRLLGGPPRR